METVLIVDDEKNYTRILGAVLEEEGFEILTANSGPKALEVLEGSDVDLVLTDMKMPLMDGIQLLEKIKTRDSELPVIMMTAHGTVDKAVEAMQKGAYSYILKPFDNDRLIIYVRKAVAMFRVIKENRDLRNAVSSQYSFGNIIGKSKVIQQVFDTIRKVAPSNATVLIEGESGTGKELVAKSIHFNSPRREKPFVAVNCSALAETLLESELFGHEKGAFTGAVSMRKGRFELADTGTLFLDEIGDMSTGLQVKLLRVLQEKVFERVGGTKPIAVNIRVIAATNRNLKEEMNKGRFREDLYYRLNVVHIALPSLKQSVPVTGIDPDVERLFYEYSWPGNVRELENLIERLMIMSPGGVISPADLPKSFKETAHDDLYIESVPVDAKLYDTLTMIEKTMILRALKKTGYVQSRAAELLGIGKSGLNQKIKKYNLDVGSK
jgi:two-component system NtrC family response regulator